MLQTDGLAEKLRPLPLCSTSVDLQVGQKVFAIGNVSHVQSALQRNVSQSGRPWRQWGRGDDRLAFSLITRLRAADVVLTAFVGASLALPARVFVLCWVVTTANYCILHRLLCRCGFVLLACVVVIR